jgi:hypothetical protein
MVLNKQPGRVRSGAKFLPELIIGEDICCYQKNKSRQSRLLQEPSRTAKKNCKDKTRTRGHCQVAEQTTSSTYPQTFL